MASSRSGRSHVASSVERFQLASPISAVAFATVRRTCRAGVESVRCAILKTVAATATTTTAIEIDSVCAQ